MLVADHFRFVDHQHHFGVAGQARADFFVGRVRGVAARITHHGADHAFAFPELAFRTPEAAQTKNRKVDILREWAQQRLTGNVVGFRQLYMGVAARQGLFFSG